MEHSEEFYRDYIEYREELVLLGRCYAADFLRREEQSGEEGSLRQHLQQDTVLRSEVQNFLKGADCALITELEGRLAKKAENSRKKGSFLPFEHACRVFALDGFERFCVLMMFTAQLNMNFEKLYAYMNNDWKKNTLTAGLLMDMYRNLYGGRGKAAADLHTYFSENSKLMRHFFDFMPGNIYFLAGQLEWKPVLLRFLWEGRLEFYRPYGTRAYHLPEGELPRLYLEKQPYKQMLRYLPHAVADKTTVFYLYGLPGIEKRLNVLHFAREIRQAVVFLELEALDGREDRLWPPDIGRGRWDSPDWGDHRMVSQVREVLTETILHQGILCICCKAGETLYEEQRKRLVEDVLLAVRRELSLVCLVMEGTKKVNFDAEGVDVLPVGMDNISPEENLHVWMEMAKDYALEDQGRLNEVANKFQMTPGAVENILKEAQEVSRWEGYSHIPVSVLERVCFEKIEHNLGRKAQKVRVVYRWEDLILPELQRSMLKRACDQVRYRYKVFTEWGYSEKLAYGTGLSMLFAGMPGTGKTMAAQVVAGELGLELYKIELPCVVSKYIGETEQNLNEIFEEAKKSQAIIFFDEADVLFSKRSEIKDSNDKYSNMEAAFMLQKMEEYKGCVILATNFQQNIDEAFKRRIKFLIDFPFPEAGYRRQIWKKAFPARLPLLPDIDYDFLAERFELSGSNIKNIALGAAFLAAAEPSAVGMRHIVQAVAGEYGKSGRKLSKEELGEYFMFA